MNFYASSFGSSSKTTSPSDVPLNPTQDEYPVLHWFQEVGPSLMEAIKAMVGFGVNWFG